MFLDKEDLDDMLKNIEEKLESKQNDFYKKHDRHKVYLCLLLALSILVVGVLGTFLSRQFQKEKELEERLERQQLIIESFEGNRDENTKNNETVPVVTSETLKSALGGLSKLVTQEYAYRNADKKSSSDTWMFGWERPFSGKSILITYDGIIEAGIDFNEIKVDVDDDKHVVTVTLPESEITRNDIPQETIEIVEVKDGLFNEVTQKDFNDFVTEQKPVMEAKAIEQGILERANSEAKELVRAILSVMPGMDEYKLIIN